MADAIKVERTQKTTPTGAAMAERYRAKSFGLLDIIEQRIIEVDALVQYAQAAKCSAETTLAWRSVQMAKSWLHETLFKLYEKSPFVFDNDRYNIKAAKDYRFTDGIEVLSELGDNCAAMISKIEWIMGMIGIVPSDIIGESDSLKQALRHLTEAKFWYQIELDNLRLKKE